MAPFGQVSLRFVGCKAEDGANVNQAESYFSRLRRAEIGQHHRIRGHLLHQYANEAAWREDNRRKPNGTNWNSVIGAALTGPKRARFGPATGAGAQHDREPR